MSGSALIVMIGAALGALAIAIGHSLLVGEVRAWLPHLARRLVKAAARRLPPRARSRYESDWLAELAAWEDRPVSALAKAAHLRWRAGGIRESLCGVPVKGDRLKRGFDIAVAAAALVVFTPTLLITAIAIKLESRGPVFYRQRRLGRDGESFALFKFRTLYFYGECDERRLGRGGPDGVLPTNRSELRITRVGRSLRRSALDELPQLINILRGDMSLVGPRPLIQPEELPRDRDMSLVGPRPLIQPEEAEELPRDGDSGAGRDEELWSLRSAVRPGLIGIAQLELSEGRPLTFEQVAELDAAYARSRSFRSDLRLLLRSIARVWPRRSR